MKTELQSGIRLQRESRARPGEGAGRGPCIISILAISTSVNDGMQYRLKLEWRDYIVFVFNTAASGI